MINYLKFINFPSPSISAKMQCNAILQYFLSVNRNNVVSLPAKVTTMELRVKLRYKSTSDFGKGDQLQFDNSLAHALEWLYDEDLLDDEHTWFYCMEGVLPIYVMISIVTDIFVLSLQEYAATNIKDYILRMEDGNDKSGWNENKPSLVYLDGDIVIGRVRSFTSEVILWAAYLYVCLRADIGENNEKFKRAKDVLYKLFWKKTGLKEEFVKESFLMTHFDQTKHDFAMDVLRRFKEEKSVVDNDSNQPPINVNMEESVLNRISASDMRYYYEGWRNGKHGAICQRNSIYRFVEQARGESGMLDDVKKDEKDNPIVAIGIVAFWLQFNSRKDTIIKRLTKYNCEIPKDIRELFDNYTKIRFEQFKKEHRDDPDTWDWNWEYEFYAKVIIPKEISFNKRTEALFDYISDSDIVLVRAVMTNYIKYLKKTRTEKGYRVSPEFLVLRSIATFNKCALEDLEDNEISTILDKLESEGYVKVAWVEGHSPEDVRLLDKGRTYLKQLEEGKCVIDVPPVDTQQPSSEEFSTGDSSQMTQPDDDSEYNQDVEDEEWDDTYDYIFEKRVKPQALFKALKGIKYSEKITDRRFYYVAYRVFDAINYFSKGTSEHHYLRWINLHYNDSENRWIDDHAHLYLFRFKLDGTAKELKVHPSKWNTIKMYSDLAEIHFKLANAMKNTFTFVVDDNGRELKDSESYEHLKDYPQYLSGAKWIIDRYLVLDEAYINKG
ncbi:MAG: hypothetical protein K6G70_06600 [Bacteroidaceae bacterium]|nr:hypothetical protein [Bacteroidaceae bacterium]